jgi:hypothetical protein
MSAAKTPEQIIFAVAFLFSCRQHDVLNSCSGINAIATERLEVRPAVRAVFGFTHEKQEGAQGAYRYFDGLRGAPPVKTVKDFSAFFVGVQASGCVGTG